MNFMLCQEDIDSISKMTIIPFVNRHFVFRCKDNLDPENRQTQKIKPSSESKSLPIKIIVNRMEKMGKNIAAKTFFSRMKIIAGSDKLSWFLSAKIKSTKN